MNNWPSWLIWKTIIVQKELQYTLNYNNSINETNTNIPNHKLCESNINYIHIRYDTLYPTWQQVPIEHNLCRFIRHLQNAYQIVQWHSQMRIQCWNILRPDTDWTTFYKYINYKCVPTWRETNPKYSKIKAFKLKLLLEELLTLEVLHERNPKKYLNLLCFRCKETTESNYHLLTCKENSISIRRIITETVNKILISHEVYEQNIQ